ncbi:N-acetylneuraminate-9-phosphate synthase-like [Styela clava]
MATFEISPGRWIGGEHPCFIIAEIGQNHQGDIEIAKEMIKMAKDCGADCAKFQKCQLDQKFNKKALQRPYTSKHSWGATYGEHKAFIEFTEEQFIDLRNYANEIGIIFSSSAGDASSIDLLDRIGVPFFKIASVDAGNYQFIQHAASKGKPLIISTGMQNMDTVREVYQRMKKINPKFSILQCTSTYPQPVEDTHLRVIQSYKTEFPEVPIGYSGHEAGTAITIAAVTLGAKIVERHVTLDKNWKGNDHMSSLEPRELKQLVEDIRTVEKALGTTEKKIRKSEEPCYLKLGKTVVASHKLTAGHVITENDLAMKVAEPKGIRTENCEKIIGRRIKRNIEEDESIIDDDIE